MSAEDDADGSRPINVPGPSIIQTLSEYYPSDAAGSKPILRSTGDTGEQSPSLESSSQIASDSCLPRAPNDLPSYMSAFEYAIKPFLDDDELEHYLSRPSPTDTGSPSKVASPGSCSDESNSTFRAEWRFFGPRLQVLKARTMLLRCQILSDTVREIQRKPWKLEKGKLSTTEYFQAIKELSLKAMDVAVEQKSDDLRARCEYWAGRAASGTKDYFTALYHLENALKLGSVNDTTNYEPRSELALKQSEKEDLVLLLEGIQKRVAEWKQNNPGSVMRAEYEAKHFSKSFEECIVWPKGSPDLDLDREKLVWTAPNGAATAPSLGSEMPEDHKHTSIMRKGKEVGNEEAWVTKGSLSKEEWRYVEIGTSPMQESNTSAIDPSSPNVQNKSMASLSLGTNAGLKFRNRTTWGASELSEQSSDKDTDSDKEADQSLLQKPAKRGKLSARRDIDIHPINTSTRH